MGLDKLEEIVGIPYKKEPPYSLEKGVNCLAWVSHVYQMHGINLFAKFNDLRYWREHFIKIKGTPKFLDIVLMYSVTIGERHVGVMLDDYRMTQSSSITNGVAICEISRNPWVNAIKGFYRYK